jgi:glutathione peroxidase
MKKYILLGVLAAIIAAGSWAYSTYASGATYEAVATPMAFHDLHATTLEGEPFSFESLRGRPVLIVNTASKCGFTPQYEALEALHEAYAGELVILGFPCNDFADQEPGSNGEIAEFCERNYGVSFPMMSKVHVGGPDQHPVYNWLCDAAANGVADHEVKWNFHKFVVDAEGRLRGSFRSAVAPDDASILNALFSE